MNPRAWTDSASQQLHTLAPSLLSRTVYEQESSVGVLTALLAAASDGVVPWPSRKGCPPRSAGATEHVKREFQARIGASARLRDEGPRCSTGTGAKRPVARGFAITVPSGWFAQQPQRTRLPSGAIFDPDTSGRLTQGSLLSNLTISGPLRGRYPQSQQTHEISVIPFEAVEDTLNHTHFSPHLLATASHNQQQVPNGEKPQISLWRNGFHS